MTRKDFVQVLVRSAGMRISCVCAVLFALFFSVPAPLAAEDEAAVAAKIKAAYLFNLTKFIDWPVAAFAPGKGPAFRICIAGTPPLWDPLQRVKGEKVGERTIELVALPQEPGPEMIAGCQIVYSGAAAAAVKKLFAAAESAHTLTVAEGEAGAINFTIQENTVKFEVDLPRARAAGLQISGRLLSVAAQVKQ